MDINELNKCITDINDTATKHGWYVDQLSDNHYFMMMITEIAEAIQADRINKYADMKSFNASYYHKSNEEFIFPDDCYNDNELFMEAYTKYIENTVDGEVADIVIRILSFMGMHNYKITKLPKIKTIAKQKESDSYMEECTFTEVCLDMTAFISRNFTGQYSADGIVHDLCHVIAFIYEWCKHLHVDLDTHIKLKMRYNTLREYKHGKKY